MTVPSPSAGPLALRVRRGRNALALVLLVALSALALYVAYTERASLGLSHWWVAVFPTLAVITAYRLVRPRVPLALDAEGLRVASGSTLLGLRTTIDWRAVKRLRVTAAGLLLVELRDSERWARDKPWLVRANMRTNERKSNAAVVQPLRELSGTPQDIVAALRAASPVRVDAPEGMRGPA